MGPKVGSPADSPEGWRGGWWVRAVPTRACLLATLSCALSNGDVVIVRYRVGIDIGGTFSDLVAMDEAGRVLTLKVSSAPDQVIGALVDGLRDLQRQANLAPADAVAVVHGTTAATNALL